MLRQTPLSQPDSLLLSGASFVFSFVVVVFSIKQHLERHLLCEHGNVSSVTKLSTAVLSMTLYNISYQFQFHTLTVVC